MTSTPVQSVARFAGIDGLRAFAVLAVIVAHAAVPGFHGGGVGVDVFFGISGFLITYLLLREGQKYGQISLGRFWLRRILRLLPALLLLLVVADLIAIAILTVRPNAAFGGALQATPSVLFYFGNWMVVALKSGFLGPLTPLWSLSVEEQFYFVWPIVVLLALRVRRTLPVLAAVAIGLMVLVNLDRLLTWDGADIYRVFGTDFRVDELLAGVLLAVALHAGYERFVARASRVLVIPAAVYLLVVCVVIPVFGKSASTIPLQYAYFTGLTPLIELATVAIIGFVLTHQGGAATRVLSWWPLDYTGRISYGMYLWHYPIMFLVASVVTLNPYVLLLVVLVGTYTAASLSWAFVERPIQARFHARLKPVSPSPKDGPIAASAAS